ncbi:MAG: argininosuccinate lyase [bacterium]|jgi:argininosuccinate lyase|nr:argininosuccinate lyase [bacterium]MBK9775947.1 argininosuccinate lyase [bacterium]
MSTLWTRADEPDPWLQGFLAGDDHVLDRQLLPYDCRASLAHARMLARIGVLDPDELRSLEAGLAQIEAAAERGGFPITAADEDCHTAIENHLTKVCGEAGRKIHTGRSRNDQVLTALRLWEKDHVDQLLGMVVAYVDALYAIRQAQGQVSLPGYTHMQAAMPTTVDVWLGSYADAARDDHELLSLVRRLVDRCPLGTAAGFGVPVLDLDREGTAAELGFAEVLANPMYAQLSRGRLEALLLAACSQVMLGLSRLASDLLLFSTREFGLVALPPALCTGSSLMPQKRNPDVLELVRARFHVVAGEEAKVRAMTAGLISGYNRDVQLTKGPLFAGVAATVDSLRAMALVLANLRIDPDRCAAAVTDEMRATERALKLVAEGVPFRDAYRRIAAEEAARNEAINGS